MKSARQLWLIGVLLLSGCVAGYTLVEPERRQIGELYTVQSPIAWSAQKQRSIEIWTVDGPALEAIYFASGLKDGDPFFEPGEPKEKRPQFRSNMSPNEVMEFIIDSWAAAGAAEVDASGLRPALFGDLEGYRFEFTYLTAEGLESKGLAVGTVKDEKLYAIVYAGASMHYFPKHKPDVEKIIESIGMV